MNIIILPIHYWSIKTKLSKKEVVSRLKKITAPVSFKNMFVRRKGMVYEGTISDATFKISRIIYYRNSFIPIVIGNIVEEKDETVINIKFRLHHFVLMFLGIWLFSAFVSFVSGWMNGEVEVLMAFLFLFVLLLYITAFNLSIRKEKKDIADCLR